MGRSGRSTVSLGKPGTSFYKLDWWVLNRATRWAWKKHGKPPWRVIRAKYVQRDPKGRINFTCRDDNAKFMWVYRLGDRPIVNDRVI